jgi:twitching motility protein PilT
MARLDSFLRLVSEQRASDLHIRSTLVPTIRHDGDLMDIPFRPLAPLEAERFLFEIMTEEQRRTFARKHQVDFMYELAGAGRFRANVFRESRGVGAVFRVIPDCPPTLDELGMPPVVKKLTQLNNGLVIVTGPTGAGKTTTLAAMIREINTSSYRHVITIEDPMEFVYSPLESMVTQREIGRHVESFAAGLRSALREAPDVLVVGEMRDQETVQRALSAAETGVLVLATLHTNSAAHAVDRIIDAAPEDSRDQARGVLSVLLRGVVAQQLVRRANAEGRIAAVELLLQTPAVSNMIREGKTHLLEGHLQSAGAHPSGAQSLDASLLRHVVDGLVTPEEALRIARQPELLLRQIAERRQDS